jgi:hypothetical protein
VFGCRFLFVDGFCEVVVLEKYNNEEYYCKYTHHGIPFALQVFKQEGENGKYTSYCGLPVQRF